MAKVFNTTSGNIAVLNGSVTIDCRSLENGAVGIQVTGTWAATHKVSATRDGAIFVDIAFIDESTGSVVAGSTGFTANGLYRVEAVGYKQVKVTQAARTSGTAVVTLVCLEG